MSLGEGLDSPSSLTPLSQLPNTTLYSNPLAQELQGFQGTGLLG